MKHIFGYTPPSKDGQMFVPYCMAFRNHDGTIDLQIRQGGDSPAVACITLPQAEAEALAAALAVIPRDPEILEILLSD